MSRKCRYMLTLLSLSFLFFFQESSAQTVKRVLTTQTAQPAPAQTPPSSPPTTIPTPKRMGPPDLRDPGHSPSGRQLVLPRNYEKGILSQEKEKLPSGNVSIANLMADKKAKKAWERGDKAFRKNRFEEALSQFRAAADRDPKYALAWLSIGQCYVELHRLEEAREAISKSLAIDGYFTEPHVEMARVAFKEKNWTEVVHWTERALNLDPVNFPETYVMHATAHMYLNHMDVAEMAARRACRLDPQGEFPQTFLILARILQAKQDRAGEREQLLSYLKQVPKGRNADIVRRRLRELE